MRFADVFIRRPVFATMLVGSLVVLGLFSYRSLGLDLFPNVDFPIVTVTTTLKGASVEEMETGVTKVLEEAINTIDGIDELRSVTKEGLSTIVVQFVLEKSRDVAAQDVRDKVSRVLAQLPVGTDPPVIEKFDMDAIPVVGLAISGRRSLREVTEIARKQIKEHIETLSGVGQVVLIGGEERAINIFVDPDRLTAQGLSIAQVRTGIRQQNLELPGGRLDQTRRELVVRTMGRVEQVADFNDLIITHVGERPLRVRDVGYAEDGVVEPRSVSRLNGQNAVQLVVRKQSGTNTVEVIDLVKAELDALRPARPAEEENEPPRRAASLATAEIALAVTATTLSLVIIFLPVAFMAGRVGRFFHSFGLTVAFAIMVSLLVSFTLTPTLSARVLRRRGGDAVQGGFVYRAVERLYGAVLRWALAHRAVIVLLAVLTAAATVPLFHATAQTFLPLDDQREMEITIRTPGRYSH